MVKSRMIFLMLTAVPLLVSCGAGSGSSSSLLSETSSSPSTSETSSVQDTSLPPSSSSSSSSVSYLWNKDIDALLGTTLGEYASFLPVLGADSYQGHNSINKTYGIEFTSIICLGEGMESGGKSYAAALNLLSWTVSYNKENSSYGAYGRVAFDSIIQTTFLSSALEDGTPYTAIAAWLYHDKVKAFPSEEATEYLGESIPEIKAPYYSFEKTNYLGMDLFCIYCYGLTSSSVTDYSKILEDSGWALGEEAGTATSPTAKSGLNFGYMELEDGSSVFAILCYIVKK